MATTLAERLLEEFFERSGAPAEKLPGQAAVEGNILFDTSE